MPESSRPDLTPAPADDQAPDPTPEAARTRRGWREVLPVVALVSAVLCVPFVGNVQNRLLEEGSWWEEMFAREHLTVLPFVLALIALVRTRTRRGRILSVVAMVVSSLQAVTAVGVWSVGLMQVLGWGLWFLWALVSLVVGLGSATEPAATPSPTVSIDAEADSHGDDPTLDIFWEACAQGDMISCEDLAEASPADSDYAAFGLSCGERTTVRVDCRDLGVSRLDQGVTGP